MTVTQLASAEDVVAAIGRDLTAQELAKVEAILDKASELFRRRSGQTFTEGRSQVRLKVNGGKVYLPQRPIVTIHSLMDDYGSAVSFTRFQQWLTVPMISHQFVIVDYSHGADAPPDIVRLAIAEIAKKVLTIDPRAATGLTQYGTTTGPFSSQSSYATWAQGGQTMLAPDDLALADTFKVKIPSVIVQNSRCRD